MAHPHNDMPNPHTDTAQPQWDLHPDEPIAASAYTPILDTRAGRLAELVHLLADVPLDRAVHEIDRPTDAPSDDPLWTVAGALVRLRAERGAAELVLA